MSDLLIRIGKLSPGQRKLLEMRKAEKLVIPKLKRASRKQRLPLSFAQQRLWLMDQLEPGSELYNIPLALRVKGALEIEVFRRAVSEIVRRHEVLRTSYRTVDGEVWQEVECAECLVVQEEDLRGWASEEQSDKEVERLAREEAAQPFDLGHGPLLRVKLLRLGEQEHVLLVTMHHIVSDGWSRSIFVRELGALYQAYQAGEESPLPELKAQYADYAVWQREWLQGEVLEEQLRYWRKQLAEMEPLDLPTDHVRPRAMSHKGASRHFVMESSLTGRLKELSRREGVTLFMSLLAGLQVVLSKYAGQQDIAVGTVVANRQRVEVEGLIGFFVNTLVLRTEVGGNPSWKEVLRRVRQVTLGAYQNQDVPFEKLVEELQPERDLSRTPLFQVMLVLQNNEEQELEMEGLRLSGFGMETRVAKFDLQIGVKESGEGMVGEISYARELYEEGTVERLVEHLRMVLEEMVGEGERGIGEMSLLRGAEREQILNEWNRTEVEYPQRSVHELFEEQVERTPEAVAVEYEGRQMSYAELNRRANQLGHYLRKQGVGPEVRVGICVERSLEMVVGLLGILKAGGAYVPLDASYPEERLEFMVKDVQAAVLLTQTELLKHLPQSSPCTVCLDEKWERIAQESEKNLATNGDRETLAYVMYTSGSTGGPKGVAVEHRSIVRLVKNSNFLQVGEEDVFLQLAPISFDASTLEIWGCLLNGGKLVVHPAQTPSLEELGERIERSGITTTWLTAGLFHQMVEGAVEKLGGVRQLLAGGDVLSGAHIKRALAVLPGTRIINGYGPTENTTFTCCHGMEQTDLGGIEENVPIGVPISNTQVYVLGAEMEAVPMGAVGELCAGGAGLARGYINQPELTAEKFVPNPFIERGEGKEGERLYRTGDRVRWRSDGKLEFLGRIDEQVKVRGYRIELGEIEGALREHGSVEQAVVVARTSTEEAASKQIVAYIVSREGAEGGSNRELKEYLRGRLPEYMVPSAFVQLEELPLTANGKVDRRALPEPEYEEREEQRGPRTPEEEILLGIFAEVLKLERVGVEQDFFELGGHSLLATQVISRVRSAFNVELPLRALFEFPTVAGLAEQLGGMRGAGHIVASPMVRVSREGDLPLSYAQQRLWFLQQLEPESVAYNMPFGIRLRGELEQEALSKSLKELVRRHEVLRTRFVFKDGRPVQAIGAEQELKIEEIDLREAEEEEREAEGKRLAEEEGQRGFDLQRGPLVRVKLLRLGEQEHVLLVTMHHIVSDGWSLGIMAREIGQLYGAYVQGEESPLPELPVQYADYAVWQREWLQGEVLEEQLRYWRKQLAEMEPLDLATDHVRPAVMSQRGSSVAFRLSGELSEQLKELSRREGVTLFMSLLAGLQVVLSKYAGQQDIAVGTVVANRQRVEVEGLIGFFVNTLVLRTEVGGNPSWKEVLRRVRQVTLGAYQNQDVPFEKLVEELQPERDLSRTPLFQVMLVLQNNEEQELEMEGLRLSGFGMETRVAKFDLQIGVKESGEGMVGEISYARELYEEGTVERLVEHLRMVLEEMVGEGERGIGEMSLLRGAEREQVLVEWNRTACEYPQRSVHELFEEQVERTPEAVAVEYEGQRMSYAELNRRANQLGHYLSKQGVGLEVRVGICVERSLEMVVGLLGILKAGGAYVPLDPNHPAERLSFMLSDSGVGVLVTQGQLEKEWGEYAGRRVKLNEEWERIEQESEKNLARNSDRENLAYVIYTSGSTGKPKGVGVSHGALTNFLETMRERPGFVREDVLLAVTTLSFDIAGLELYVPLTGGGQVRLASRELSRDGVGLGKEIERGVTVMQATPATWRMLVKAGWKGKEGLKILCGGEALGVELGRELAERGGELWNMYGPTETTIWSVVERVEGCGEKIRIGRPIGNTRVYVLGVEMEAVPVGVGGELYLGGQGVARGYVNRPEVTAERFIPDPFSEKEGERLYRSGDRVRWRRDGGLEYLGRVDYQVKVRGYRIELGEIESVLREQAGVKQAVVVLREDDGREQRLVAYVVAGEGTRKEPVTAVRPEEELREGLKRRLPEYMVPAVIMLLEELPLTTNGKVDRKALPKPEYEEREEQRGPRTPEEEILSGIFAEVLKLERVGMEQDFFEAGGHSLLATQVIARVRNVFGVELPLRTIFESPTVAGLGERIRQAGGADQIAALPLVHVAREGDMPLSYAQQRLWFLDQLQPGSAAYNLSFGIRMRGEVNRDGLRWAFQEIVKRHETLRTSITVRDGRPVQAIVEEFHLPLEEIELGGGVHECEAKVRLWVRQESSTPFDLARGPLVRVKVLRLSEREHVMLVTMHHIVSDGWSMEIIVREFSRLYEAHRNGEEVKLPELPVQYADYAIWQREWLQGEVLKRQIDYWKKQLQEVETLELPVDRPRPALMSQHGARIKLELSADLTQALKVLSRGEGVTLFMSLLAGWQFLMSRYSGQGDIAVGIPIAGRTLTETSGLIGCFVNTLVLRTRISGELSWRALLEQVRERALEAYEHQDVPFEKLVEELQPERNLSRHPLFQVMFGLQNLGPHDRMWEKQELGGLHLQALESEDEAVSAKFDLMLLVTENEQGLHGSLEYNTDLFDRTTVEMMIRRWTMVLEQVVQRADQAVSQISLVSEAEREVLARGWSGPAADCVGEQSVGAWVAEHAKRRPQAVAMVAEGWELTYGELNRQANQWAHFLIKDGVRAGMRVGVCLEQAASLVVVSLGVLKSGGVLVGLDAQEPALRMKRMLQGSNMELAITAKHLADKFSGSGVRLLYVDEQWEKLGLENDHEPEIGINAEDAACVLYRSSVIGQPEGVVIKQRVLCGPAPDVRSSMERGNSLERVALVWSFAPEAASVEMFRALVRGAQVVELSDGMRAPRKLAALLRNQGVTVWWTTTARLERVAREFPWALTKIQQIMCEDRVAGLARLRERLPMEIQERVYGVHGSSETGGRYMMFCLAEMTATGAVRMESVEAGAQLYVLGREMEPVVEGELGEIYVGSAWLSCEPLEQLSGNAGAFVANPYSEQQEARMYRTGDWAWRRADGTLEYRGRQDGRTMVNGVRVACEEIESALLQHEEVSAAAVVMREEVGDVEAGLVALVVEEQGEAVVREQLRVFLEARLPEFMVPGIFISVDEIPREDGGAVDRRALVRLVKALESSAVEPGYVAPRNAIETQIAAIWAEELKVDQVGRYDNFFKLGGQSLLAVRVIERMRQSGFEVDVRELFVAPTLAELAALAGKPGESSLPEMLPLARLSQEQIEEIVHRVHGTVSNVQDVYPLTPLQEGILFHHLLEEDGDPYLVAELIGFASQSRLDGYLEAMRAVIDRHDTLRTAVVWEGLAQPVQVVWRKVALQVEEVVVESTDGNVAAQLYSQFDPRRFRMDVSQAPLIRVYIAEDKKKGRWLMMLLLHHLTVDHTTLEVLQWEIQEHLLGHAGQLPAPMPLRNLVEHARLNANQEKDEIFFRRMLEDMEEPTAPFGLLDAQADGTGIEETDIWLESALADRLRQRARTLGVSVASVFHLVWAQVLARVSGREDVVFGTVLFGRLQGGQGAGQLMGLFINTLPIRIRVGELGAEASVQRTHALVADLLSHEHASLALAQRCSGVPAPTPLFSALLNYRYGGAVAQAPSTEAQRAWEGIELLRVEERTNYPLVLSVDDLREGFRLVAQAPAWIGPKRVCEYVNTAVTALIQALETAPATAVRTLEVMTEAEREQVLVEWNRTATEYPRRCVHELFEEQVERTPEAVAVEFEGLQLSFAELNRRANQLAHHLRRKKVGPEVLVGICVERSMEMMVGLLGILKTGAAYVPLDPGYPSERLGFMLEDAQIPLLLTHSGVRDRLPSGWVQVVVVDQDWREIERESFRNPSIAVSGANLAYVIYTSGSSGHPKGVGVTHGGLANYLNWAMEAYKVEQGGASVVHSSLGFDLTVTSIYPALLRGGCVTVLPQAAGIEELAESLKRREYSLLKATPSHLQVLSGLLEKSGQGWLGARALVIGGEALKYSDLELWRKREVGVRLINEYGPTETVVGCVTYEVGDENGMAEVPIGRPIGNTQVYVLDENLAPAPVGVSGELYLGGAGVARGYVNQPELTAEKFIPNPFSGKEGERMYRTGDRGRWRSDGTLEFLGRLDDQVKVRGYRIELGEIEAALLECASVKQAVVVVREDHGGDKRLMAYVVLHNEAGSSADLREYLHKRLPEYMVPGIIVRLAEMPLTANGKVDRKALPSPDLENGMGAEQIAPRSAEEEILIGIFTGVLNRERVGVKDNFFEMGGHSLLATRVMSRVRSAFGVELPLRALFEAPTVAGLAERVRSLRGTEQVAAPSIMRVPRGGDLPLSFAQQRLWFLHQLEPESVIYSVPFGIRLSGELEQEVLSKSLNELVRRHEVLRTHFVFKDGRPMQVIGAEQELKIKEIDLQGMADVEREAEALRLWREEVAQPFDLGCGPLLRASLLQLAEQEYLLLAIMHHIVSDGWSTGIMIRELSQLYQAYVQGEESPLAELPVQYADYAVWQREWLQGEVLEEQLKYWRKQLAEMEPLDLPTDHLRPAVMNQRGVAKTFTIGKQLSEQLKELSQREGVTLFMSLLAGLQVVLSKYTGQQDIAVGTVVANRQRVEVEGLIGFFVNTLVLRTEVGGNPSWKEVLRRVRQVTLGAYQNQDVPFEKLVEELQPERDLSRSPLFQVMLVLQNNEQEELHLPGVRLSGFAIKSNVAKFDLQIGVKESGEGMVGEISYARELYEEGTVERLVEHLRMVLEEMVGEGERGIGEMSLLRGAEREQILNEWNRTEVEYPQRSVHELFEEQVERTPEAVAVEYEGQCWSYRELNERANQLAHYLQELGVGPEVRVGICVERSLEMVVGLLGILKAGGAYVPLSPEYPVERLALMMEDSGIPVLLGQSHLLKRLPTGWVQTFCLDSEWEQLRERSRENTQTDSTSRTLAYVMYTSGSTGGPKGVAVEHRSIVRLVKNSNFLQVGEEDVFLQLAPISFDASTLEIWGCLLNGGKLVVHPAQTPSLEELGERIERSGITTTWLTAGLFHQMVEGAVEKLGGVRQLLAGGDVLSGAHIKRALAVLPGTRIINGYGPTENTTFTCCHGMEQTDLGGIEENVPIGVPISNTQVYVLGAEMEAVPMGAVGELCAGGAGLARGYINQPELTAEKFVPNPFIERGEGKEGERLYRTGDRVRWRSDGKLEFLGRIDEQVKVRGYRIELGEIEGALREHGSVEQAVVVARTSTEEAASKQIVAYIVSREGAEGGSNRELKEYLRGRLPEYMVPSAFVQLEELPLTANGKVDRRALPEPEYEEREEQRGPRTPEEEILLGIFAEVLKLERVGVEQDFFELGGHSLLATQVISRVRSAFNVELPLRALFEFPTVAGLAEQLGGMRGAGHIVASPMVRVSREGDLPLSYAQQRLWFLQQLEPESVAYNMPFGIRLRGELEQEALSKSLKELVRRHEVLRTRFVFKDGRPVQAIGAEQELKIEEIDLREAEEEEREAEGKRLAEEEGQRGFDLQRGPLVRVKLLRLGEQEHVLLVTMHHIVSDGWSLGIMAREIGQLYGAYVQGEESPLPELPVQYADYAVWQREWLQGEVLEEQLKYWRKQLAEMEPLDLATDHVRPAVMSQRGSSVAFRLSGELSEQLKELSRREGVTLFMSLLAGLQVVLSKYTGQQDIAVGTVVANRQRVEVEGLIGFFVNTLVLRTEVGGNPSWKEVLRRVRQVTLGAYQNQDVPFEKLVEELQPERDLSRTPLFQVMLVLQNNEEQELEMEGLRLSGFGMETRVAKFDLQIGVKESGEGMVGEISYARELYEEGTVERLVEHLRMVLEEMVGEGERGIGEMSLLRGAEREQVLVEWNRTACEYRQRSVHELFEEQVGRTPEAVAVEYEGRRMSYAELNRRANQLGHYLSKQGVGPEVRVGICVERSLEMVVGLLGILKAGGAYVPLEPDFPEERLAWVLHDSRVPLLLTQERLRERFPHYEGKIVALDRQWQEVAEESASNLGSLSGLGNAVYVIYTSGSTGRPKGVLNLHGGLSNRLIWMQESYGLDETDRILQKTPFTFDVSVWEFFWPLMAGSRLVMARPGGQQDPDYLIETIRNSGITTLHFVPPMLGAWLEYERAGSCRSLRRVICSGEALSVDVQKRFHATLTAELHNLYGPTEASIDVTYWHCRTEWMGSAVPIGRPISNTQVYVLDENLKPVPVGVGGELYLGGAGLARGYLNRAELTAEKFMCNPFSRVGGERLYRSGDRVRWRSDGQLMFLGRLDHQVKVRGFRIELGEIESRLLELDGMRDAVVVVREDVSGDKRLVAYYTCVEKNGQLADEDMVGVEQLQTHLRMRLPEYMLPAAYVRLEKMPLTENGKLDRKALPAPEGDAYSRREYEAPQGETETRIATIWAEELKVDRIGRHDNFFKLGGHSLLAARVVERMRRCGLKVDVRALFVTASLADLANSTEELMEIIL